MRQHQQQWQQACGRRIWTAVWVAAFALGLRAASAAPLPPIERASWIWSQESDVQCGLRKVFTPDPSQPEIHLLHLDYTPCWRAAAAWALGEIGDRRACPVLLGTVRNLDNATDVRHAAAKALGKVAVPSDLAELDKLAADYPEVSVRKTLQAASDRIVGTTKADQKLARRDQDH